MSRTPGSCKPCKCGAPRAPQDCYCHACRAAVNRASKARTAGRPCSMCGEKPRTAHHSCCADCRRSYDRNRVCPHCGLLLSQKQNLRARSWGHSNRLLLAVRRHGEQNPAVLRKVAKEFHPDLHPGDPSAHDEFIRRFNLAKALSRQCCVVFVGFRAKHIGLWWEVKEVRHGQALLERRAWRTLECTRKWARLADITDSRCGPGNKFIMIRPPEPTWAALRSQRQRQRRPAFRSAPAPAPAIDPVRN